MKKLHSILPCLIILFLAISCSKSAKYTDIEDNTDNYSNPNVGTYEVVDHRGTKWIIILNENETARIYKDGSDKLYYGTWYHSYKGNSINMNSDPAYPGIVFPDGEWWYVGSGIIVGNFLYRSEFALNAQNPTERLQIKKVN